MALLHSRGFDQHAHMFNTRLSEDEAWSIAMMWQEPLRGCVRLATDKSDSMRLVKSYEWVRFEASGITTEQNARAFGVATRYAAMTWLALSCVPEFSGAENPVFWRRVFDTLQWQDDASRLQHRSEYSMDNRPISSVTDAIRFFPDENKPFPRFQLALSDRPGDSAVVTFCRVFCGTLDHVNEISEANFQTTLARLLPFTNRKDVNRILEVGFLLRGLNPNTLSTDVKALIESCSNNFETCSTVFQAGAQPQFPVRYVAFRGYLNLIKSSDATCLLPLINNTAVEIDQVYFSVYDAVTREAFASFVKSVFRVDEQAHARVRRLSFPMNCIAEDTIGAICSALPHARSVKILRLDRRSCSSRTMLSPDVAWLAYAIFHPGAAESSWKALDLEMVDIAPEYADVFRTMSKGNNLLTFLDGVPATSQAYYSARFAEGTRVYSEPQWNGTILNLNGSSTRFDVCVNSDDITTMDDWVSVIVPCWGRGWVQKHFIIDVIARRPSRSFLTGLGVTSATKMNAESVTLNKMLQLIGTRLEHLDIAHAGKVSPNFLRGILAVCPALRSLHISHDGAIWTEASAMRGLSHLEELGLILGEDTQALSLPCDQVLVDCLQALTALRISTTRHTNFNSSREALLSILKHLPSLQYLHWDGPSSQFRRRDANPTPYVQSRKESWEQLDISSTSHLAIARGDFGFKHLIALLSVVKQKEAEDTPLAFLNHDLVNEIATYAGTTRPRDLSVES